MIPWGGVSCCLSAAALYLLGRSSGRYICVCGGGGIHFYVSLCIVIAELDTLLVSLCVVNV